MQLDGKGNRVRGLRLQAQPGKKSEAIGQELELAREPYKGLSLVYIIFRMVSTYFLKMWQSIQYSEIKGVPT